jgi:hypothetical protein
MDHTASGQTWIAPGHRPVHIGRIDCTVGYLESPAETYFGRRLHYLGTAGPVQPLDEWPLVDLLCPSGQVEWEDDRSIPMAAQGLEATKLWDEPQGNVAGAGLEFPAPRDHHQRLLHSCH